MPGMPYHLEKGPWLTVLEDCLNADPLRPLELRRQLRAGARLTDLEFLASPVLDGDPDYPTLDRRRAHLEQDWFGYGPDGRQPSFAEVVRQALPDDAARAAFDEAVASDVAAASDAGGEGDAGAAREAVLAVAESAIRAGLQRPFPSTGFWHRYYGDVEGIVTATLVRAIEVAFGIDADHDGEVDDPERRLPIDIMWKCPQRWFEGWVTWRYDPPTGIGQVTVVLATPGSGKPLLERPLAGLDAVQATTPLWAGGAEPPCTPAPRVGAGIAPKGMWVVSHEDHVLLPHLAAARTGRRGSWFIPAFGPAYAGAGPIVVVAPSEADGGVRPHGRAYQPPAPQAATVG